MLENKIKFKQANEKGSNSFGTLLNILDFKESETDKIQKTLSGEFAEEISFLSIRKQKMIPYFSAVHKIGSLPEIQVLQGFTRIENLDRSELAKTKDLIPVMKYKNNKWLPGIRNNGEVIFFRFDEHKLKEWELNTNHSEVTSDIILRYNRNRNQLGYSASGDSEGSLGGLLEQTKPNKLYPIFIRAIGRMMYCSSDPNCSEGEFKFVNCK